MIWHVPGIAAAGRVSRQLVENLDLGPTLVTLCGLPVMDWVDGADLSPILKGSTAPVREVAATENPWSKSIRWGRWRFVHYQRRMFDGHDVGELYDVESDPDETRNLYLDPDYRAVAEQCRRRLCEWLIDTTRLVTCNPALEHVREREGVVSVPRYFLAADGKEGNHRSATARATKGKPNYL